jgi:hypothetical protein
MSDVADTVKDSIEGAGADGLNTIVAVLVSLSATFMALCNVKDGNIVQAMAQAQAKSVDSWSYYQAKSTKQNIAQAQAEQLELRLNTELGLSEPGRRAIRTLAERYRSDVERYESDKAAIKAEAEGYQREYDRLNSHDDQFDMCDGALAVSLALYAVTVLTRKRWLLGVAAAFSLFGLIMGVAGFAGWDLHPDWLARLLG